MNVQQGFNRIAVSVAGTFVALAIVCIAIAGINYLQYRSEVATEFARRYADNPQRLKDERFMLPHEKRGNWETFKTNRYRSVDRSLYLSLFLWDCCHCFRIVLVVSGLVLSFLVNKENGRPLNSLA